MATFTKRIQQTADDGRTDDSPGWSTLATVFGAAGGLSFDAYFWFDGVNVPKDATVTAAKLTFQANATDSGTSILLEIGCEDADDPAAPTNYGDAEGRIMTTARTSWDNEEAWTVNLDYDSDDFASSVQEVVNRAGWVSGQAMLVMVRDDGSSNNHERRPKDYTNSSTACALLTIEYTAGGETFVARVVNAG